MLRHHNEEEHAPNLGLTPTPGQPQITPQELAQAIVSVETRQRADAPMQTKTITLEDTIRQLELTVTPEEILTELHAQRTAAHQKAVMTPRKTGRTLSWWLLLTGCILSTAATIFVSFMMYILLAKYNELWKDAMHRGTPHYAQTPSLYKPRPLSTFKPDEQAYVSLNDLQLLSYGVSPSRIMAAEGSSFASSGLVASTMPQAHWTIVQKNGRYMVRVDDLSPHVEGALDSPTQRVQSSLNTGSSARLLPVDRFKHILSISTRIVNYNPSAVYDEVVEIPRTRK